MSKSKKPADAQLVFRAETPHKIELEAIANVFERGYGDMLRELLIEQLPVLRQRADEEIKRREKIPGGITPDVLERELTALHRALMRGDPITIEPHQLLDPKSKALWVLLGFLWGEHVNDEDRERAIQFAQSLAT